MLNESLEVGTQEQGSDARELLGWVEELHGEIAKEKQARLRLLADFQNYRARTGREAGTARRLGRRDVLLPLLGILDNLERALAAGCTDAAFRQGIQAITGQCRGTLTALGVSPVPGVGAPFDPRVHEAVAAEKTVTEADGTILEEIQRGYLLEGELLRPAKVIVARAEPLRNGAGEREIGESRGGASTCEEPPERSERCGEQVDLPEEACEVHNGGGERHESEKGPDIRKAETCQENPGGAPGDPEASCSAGSSNSSSRTGTHWR